jgi:hypothetical protein
MDKLWFTCGGNVLRGVAAEEYVPSCLGVRGDRDRADSSNHLTVRVFGTTGFFRRMSS